MPTTWETFPIKFEEGLRTDLGRLDQGLQAPGSATMLQNFERSIEGGYKKILGYVKSPSVVVPGTGLINGLVIVNETSTLVSRNGTYYITDGLSWTSVGTATPTTQRVKHDSFNFDGQEKFVLVDGINRPSIFNPSGNTLTFDALAPTDIVGASNVIVFKNHLFFSKNNLLNFTAPYAPTDFTAANGAGVINVGTDVTGLIIFREQLIIFSRDKIQRLVGNTSSDFQLQPIAANTGCLSPESVQEVGGDIIYLGPDGLRHLSATERNNDFALERASMHVQREILDLVDKASQFSSVVIRAKNQYRFFAYLPATEPRHSDGFIGVKVVDQEGLGMKWSTVKGMKVYCSDSKQFRDREIVLFTSGDGYVYRMDVGSSFDGKPIPAIFEAPYMPITDPRKRKTIYKHSIYVGAEGKFNLTVSLRLDYGTSLIQPSSFQVGSTKNASSFWGEAVWGGFLWSTKLDEIFVNQAVGSGFTFALRYEDISDNPSFNLDYAILEFRENERR